MFHMRCIRCILSIHWTDKVTNNIVLERAGVPTIFTLLRQHRLRWLGHVRRMSDGRIPKDLLYGELDHGLRPVGRPKLHFKDTCKRDMIEISLDVENWETLAADCGRWRINCSACLDEGELRIRKEAMARRERRKAALNAPPASVFVCSGCSRVCSSQIGLFSHQSRCRNMR